MRKIKYNKITLETTKPVYIHPMGDFHIGHKNCNYKIIEKTVNAIENKEGEHRILLMGDLMDCGVKSSVGASVYEQHITVSEQLEMIKNLFEPVKDKIDGCVMGNHEYRIFKEVGVDILEIFCNELNIPYFSYSGVVTYSINGNRAYNFNMFHGKAGGGVENALKACKNMALKVNADVFLMGHCHRLGYTNRSVKVIDSRNNMLIDSMQHFVLTGHALDYDESYVDQANLEIAPPGFPCIKLAATGQKEISIIQL